MIDRLSRILNQTFMACQEPTISDFIASPISSAPRILRAAQRGPLTASHPTEGPTRMMDGLILEQLLSVGDAEGTARYRKPNPQNEVPHGNRLAATDIAHPCLRFD